MTVSLASLPVAQLLEQLFIDAGASWARMLVALFFSFVLSLAVGIWAARSERAGKVILPIIDIFQTLPILAFFPFVVLVVVVVLPAYIGINAAIVFLIITSMLWNMIFAVYEAIRMLPNEMLEVAELYGLSLYQKLRKIYIPAAMPRLVEQSALSWAIGLFYLVTSEIFSVGLVVKSATHGIGVALVQLAAPGNLDYYLIGLGVFILFVVATRYLLFATLEKHFAGREKATGQALRKRRLPRGVRIHRELHVLYRTLGGKPKRRLKRHLTGEPAQLAVAAQKKAAASWHKYLYLAIFIAAVALVLYAAGSINQANIGYESMVLGALAASFARVWITFIIILVVAVPVSIYLIFMTRRLKSYITLFQILASIPATIVLPIIAYAFVGNPNQGEIVAFIIFFLSGIWYVIFGAIASSRDLPENLKEVKSIFHVRPFSAWKNIYVKAIIPGLITGAVTGVAAEWNASIVAEYFTNAGISGTAIVSHVTTGIGALLDTALANNNFALMVIALINLTIMIILINTFVWKRLYKRIADIYK